MISLYESILSDNKVSESSLLSDIEDTLDYGDSKAPEMAANMEASDLRNFFGIGVGVEKPFEFSEGGKTLIVRPRSRVLRVNPEKLNDIVSTEVETLICKSSFVYNFMNPAENLCSCIKADSFNFNEFAAIKFDNMEIYAGNYSGDKIFPNITFNSGKASAELTNSRLEIDYSITRSALLTFTGDIPIFKNVKSDTIKRIEITDRRGIQFSDKSLNTIANIFGNKRWNNLFEFGYDLEINNGNNWSKASIKSMKDFRKIVASRNFWNTRFNEFPYRLKKNAKLSDFIDVSGFKSIHNIQIHDGKMNVLFINTKIGSVREFVGHVSSSLKQSVGVTSSIYDIPYPVTSDGWMVIINQL